MNNLPDAIIVDLDGTLAKMGDRSPYDFSKVSEDEYDELIGKIIDSFENNITVKTLTGKIEYTPSSAVTKIIVSGRSDECKKDTKQWLEKHNIKYNDLYMRKEGDNRKDTIVKKEIYDKYIKGKYNIICVFDDRPQVIRMWREQGLRVIDVGEGIEF